MIFFPEAIIWRSLIGKGCSCGVGDSPRREIPGERPVAVVGSGSNEPPDELDAIDHVVYVLDSAFHDPVRTVTDRSTKFRMMTSGWGIFTVYARPSRNTVARRIWSMTWFSAIQMGHLRLPERVRSRSHHFPAKRFLEFSDLERALLAAMRMLLRHPQVTHGFITKVELD